MTTAQSLAFTLRNLICKDGCETALNKMRTVDVGTVDDVPLWFVDLLKRSKAYSTEYVITKHVDGRLVSIWISVYLGDPGSSFPHKPFIYFGYP